jgi:hypothetical protein
MIKNVLDSLNILYTLIISTNKSNNKPNTKLFIQNIIKKKVFM